MSAGALPSWIPARFRSVRLLGEGGFGRVVLAEDQELGREVAIKVLHDQIIDDTVLSRFAREAKVTASLEDPHLVRLYDAQVDARGRAYIVYEFVPGPSMADVFAEQGPVPAQTVAAWLPPLSRALEVLHENGVVHRDVKPDNVLLRDGRDPVVCDLGIAQVSDSDATLTQEGMIVGTPAYMAPEVWFGDRATPASDQFSLAATLGHLILGGPVYGTGDPHEIIAFLRSGKELEVPLPAGPRGEVLGRVLRRALRREPKDRYPSLAALREDLAQAKDAPLLATQVVEAVKRVPDQGLDPTPPAVRQSPKASSPIPWVLGGAAIAGALVLGVGVFRSPPTLEASPGPGPRTPGASVSTSAPPSPTAEPLRELEALVARLDYGEHSPAPLVLEAILRDDVTSWQSGERRLPPMAEEVRVGLAGDSGSARVRSIRRLDLWRAWDRDNLDTKDARRRRLIQDCEGHSREPASTYWEASAQIECLKFYAGQRFGMNLRTKLPEDFEVWVGALDESLRRGSGAGLLLARGELWAEVGKRYFGHYPNLVAMALSQSLLEQLLRDPEALAPELRLRAFRIARQNAYELGQPRRYAALHRALSSWALEPIRDVELLEFWRVEIKREEYPVKGWDDIASLVQGGTPMLDSGLPPETFHRAGGLPIPLDFPGSAPELAPLEAPIVAASARLEPVEAPAPDQDLEAYWVARDRALIEGRTVVDHPAGWVEKELRKACADGPLVVCRDAVAFPALARGLLKSDAGLSPKRLLGLWSEAERSRAGLLKHRDVLRERYQGSAADLVALRSSLELRQGEGVSWVLEQLEEKLAILGPPWSVDEVDLGRRLWLQLADLGPATLRPRAGREAARLTLRVVEACLRLEDPTRGREELAKMVEDGLRVLPAQLSVGSGADPFPEAAFRDPLGDLAGRLVALRVRGAEGGH